MTTISTISEPRPFVSDRDVRPIVALRRDKSSPWLFAGLAAIAAMLLFFALDARRRALSQTAASPPNGLAVAPPQQIPALVVPQASDDPSGSVIQNGWPSPYAVSRPPLTVQAPRVRYVSNPAPQSSALRQEQTSPYLPPLSSAPMVVAEGQPSGSPLLRASGPNLRSQSQQGPLAASERIAASRLENPATTVPQGTLITAVLETALDSTAAGQVRALVTRDVAGFDGSRILIPRGTRLYGLYESNVAQGQKRAQIRWSRLLRPDGATIALDSPAADPLGRAGIRGKVNNHFFERLGNAVLSTTVNLGSALASRSGSSVIVAVPNGAQSNVVLQNSDQIKPTLTVKPGTRVSVFVQHDLDFTSVDSAP